MQFDTTVFLRGQTKTVIATVPVPTGLCADGFVDADGIQAMGSGVYNGVTDTGVGISCSRVPVRQNIFLWWLATGTDMVELFSR